MKKNENLHKAAKEKDDEFYTQLSDIERELINYKDHFKGKVVFCNCDDPKWSNFYKFFALNFKEYGLKKLVTVHFDKERPTYKLVIDTDIYNEMQNDDKKPEPISLEQNGDFRSQESIELLKEADIVVTNPPFSLFREYISQLITYNKKFLVIGNHNAITYKDIFNLIKENKLWLGYGFKGGNAYFATSNKKGFANNVFDEKTGLVKFRNVSWFTNLEIKKRSEETILYKKYKGNEVDYPKYDNYDAIEVSKIANIPVDYTGVMGVPITFMDQYNPEQFEIIKFRKGNDEKDLTINGKAPYFRILIKNKKINKGE